MSGSHHELSLAHCCYAIVRCLLHSKSVRYLVQWDLRSLETLRPKVAPSLCQPRAFRSLNRVDPLDSVSNYYVDHT